MLGVLVTFAWMYGTMQLNSSAKSTKCIKRGYSLLFVEFLYGPKSQKSSFQKLLRNLAKLAIEAASSVFQGSSPGASCVTKSAAAQHLSQALLLGVAFAGSLVQVLLSDLGQVLLSDPTSAGMATQELFGLLNK